MIVNYGQGDWEEELNLAHRLEVEDRPKKLGYRETKRETPGWHGTHQNSFLLYKDKWTPWNPFPE